MLRHILSQYCVILQSKEVDMELLVIFGAVLVVYCTYLALTDLAVEANVGKRSIESGGAGEDHSVVVTLRSMRWRGCTFAKARKRLRLTKGYSRSRLDNSSFIRLRC